MSRRPERIELFIGIPIVIVLVIVLAKCGGMG